MSIELTAEQYDDLASRLEAAESELEKVLGERTEAEYRAGRAEAKLEAAESAHRAAVKRRARTEQELEAAESALTEALDALDRLDGSFLMSSIVDIQAARESARQTAARIRSQIEGSD